MKFVRYALLTSGFVFVTQAFAHDFRPIKSFSDKTMRDTYAATQKLEKEIGMNSGEGAVLKAYEIKEISPKRKKGESNDALYQRVLKARIHADFSITGDDGGYSLSAPKSAQDVEKDLPDDLNSGNSSAAFVAALKDALKSGLMVIEGTGSGNNTAASIVAVVDVQNQEFFYIMDSNFGSDN